MGIDISVFEGRKILIVGDLMLDEYLWGNVERVSPEAPVQVVSVEREDHTLGGAGNVIHNLAVLGAKVLPAGVIGDKKDGERVLEKLRNLGVDTSGVIREPQRATTRKTRIIAAHQHVLRIDRETKKEITDQTHAQLWRFIERGIGEADTVLISDYGKGLLTRSLLSKIVEVSRQLRKPVIADPKGLDFTKYAGVSLLTPNRKEAGLASGMDNSDDTSLFACAKKLLDTTGIENLLITCGKDGMVLFCRDREPVRIGTEAKQVFDVSGAGDTVLAAVGLAVASGLSFEQGARIANTAAGIVVGKVGTAVVTKQELAAALGKFSQGVTPKHKTLAELAEIVGNLKKRGKRVVMTNGCFDLLHAGHIRLFSASGELGDTLIVAIDEDDSVRRLKGPGRPIIKEQERIRILSALDSVDYVTVFSGDGLADIIETVRPDVLTKGGNYSDDEVCGRDIVERHGGRVVLIPIEENVSATGIIESIRSGKECENHFSQ